MAARNTALSRPRTLSAERIVERMAAVMIDRAAVTDSCTMEDLERAGFTGPQIAAHADAARRIARARRRAA